MSHSHGEHLRLDDEQKALLISGIHELIERSKGLELQDFHSDRHPRPMTRAVYNDAPSRNRIVADVEKHLEENPVAVLEEVLVLLELIESNEGDRNDHVLNDDQFLGTCFALKRCNGWAFVLGAGDHGDLMEAVNQTWNFRFYGQALSVPDRSTAIYYLMSMLMRYAFVYGKKGAGQAHDIGHFLEDFGPGVLVCHGDMTALDWTLALAAMKLGVPALVPNGFPFELGKRITYENDQDIVDGITQFPNLRKLLRGPGITHLPDYCDPACRGEKLEVAQVVGDTADSFFIMRPGNDVQDGFAVHGESGDDLGIVITAEHAKLEDIDCAYIESRAAGNLNQIQGLQMAKKNGKLILQVGEGHEVELRKVAEVLQASVKNLYPDFKKVRVDIYNGRDDIAELKPTIDAELAARAAHIDATNEDTLSDFYYCVACSPFAPDHVCVVTPDRVPQCGRPFWQVRTGALFGTQDMTDIHHRILHQETNTYGVLEKGECLDPVKGEYQGINDYAVELTGGRTPKVYLHTLFDHPTTGCGCFGMILFHMPELDGIGIMHRGYEGAAPDGRTWLDLKYELAGKQSSGIAGCNGGYFASPKFLQGDGGWDRVVWMTEKIAKIAKYHIPEHCEITIG